MKELIKKVEIEPIKFLLLILAIFISTLLYSISTSLILATLISNDIKFGLNWLSDFGGFIGGTVGTILTFVSILILNKTLKAQNATNQATLRQLELLEESNLIEGFSKYVEHQRVLSIHGHSDHAHSIAVKALAEKIENKLRTKEYSKFDRPSFKKHRIQNNYSVGFNSLSLFLLESGVYDIKIKPDIYYLEGNPSDLLQGEILIIRFPKLTKSTSFVLYFKSNFGGHQWAQQCMVMFHNYKEVDFVTIDPEYIEERKLS